MSIPFFYTPAYNTGDVIVELDEASSLHIVQVLRMKQDEKINLTDGKGNLLLGTIDQAHKKHCSIRIIQSSFEEQINNNVCICISLLKNTSRFEWFLEKVTELGVSEIIPLLCARTEKEKFRYERMKAICISAMLQSQQSWLPTLHEPTEFSKVISTNIPGRKLIAHCMDGNEKQPIYQFRSENPITVLIGPEGDFASEELQLALEKKYTEITLGHNRLRTETAGVAAAVILCSGK